MHIWNTLRPVQLSRLGTSFAMTLVTGRIQLGALHIHSENCQGKQGRGKKFCALRLQWRMEERSHVSKVITHVCYRRFFQCNISQIYLGQGVKVCPMSDSNLWKLFIFRPAEKMLKHDFNKTDSSTSTQCPPVEISLRRHWHSFQHFSWMAVVPRFTNRQYSLYKNKKSIVRLPPTKHACNGDIHLSKKCVKVGFICYTLLRMPRIYGMSKHPSQSKA